MIIIHIYEVHMIFRFMYTLGNDEFKVTRKLITLEYYHFLKVSTQIPLFWLFWNIQCIMVNTFITLFHSLSWAIEHHNLFFLSSYRIVSVGCPFPLSPASSNCSSALNFYEIQNLLSHVYCNTIHNSYDMEICYVSLWNFDDSSVSGKK
jgi:hypothetical protein